jgi:DNA/RNA endonuclease G (NUC1)
VGARVGAVFDRGHMVPNASMERSLWAMINTYMFSNMTPQHPEFNRET